MASHSQWFNLGRDPCACKGWYLANELSTGLGLRKMTAAAAVLPPLWQRVVEGDARWGSARRLQRLWKALASAHRPALPADPVEGGAPGWCWDGHTDQFEPGQRRLDPLPQRGAVRVHRRRGHRMQTIDSVRPRSWTVTRRAVTSQSAIETSATGQAAAPI